MISEIDSWLSLKAPNTRRKYSAVFAEFLSAFAILRDDEKALKSVSYEHALRYLSLIRARPAQPGRSAMISDRVSENTLRQKIAVLHAIWEVFRASGHVAVNPFDRAMRDLSRAEGNDRRPHQLIPFEKVAELFRLYYNGNKGMRDRALLALLFGGALRVSEATGLRMCDVADGVRGAVVLQLRNTKKQRAELQTLPAWASEYVRAYRDVRRFEGAKERDPFLVNYRKGASENTPLLDRTVRNMFRKYMIAINLKGDHSPHCARATAITRLLEKGRTHRDVMKFSRHSSVDMVAHYDKLRDTGAESVAADLDY